ncbi:hypothetical protein QBC45DRAFT_424789 [Copromyces sp. CBS 386.78]|nr:hypothetical protein QBC45DRAFT_424789 [Copromyces sp. CBS 386.78]
MEAGRHILRPFCNVGSPRGPLELQRCRSWPTTRRLVLETVNPSQIQTFFSR